MFWGPRTVIRSMNAEDPWQIVQLQTAPITLAAMPLDIRWQQRFANFCQALDQLETFFQPPALNERERQGLIKAFEYCFELGWKIGRAHV